MYFNYARERVFPSFLSFSLFLSLCLFSALFSFFSPSRRNLSWISCFIYGCYREVYLLYRYRSRTLMLNNTAGKLLSKNQELVIRAGRGKRTNAIISNTFSVDAKIFLVIFRGLYWISSRNTSIEKSGTHEKL